MSHRVICALEWCDNHVIQPPQDSRRRLYCCSDHRLEARRRRRLEATAADESAPQAVPPPEQRGFGDPADRAAAQLLNVITLESTASSPTTSTRSELAQLWRLAASHRRLLLGAALVATLALLWPSPGELPWPVGAGEGSPPAAVPTASSQSSGLIAVMRSNHDAATGRLLQTKQDLAQTQQVIALLRTSPAGSTPTGAARLAQAQRRETQLSQNEKVFTRSVNDWITYLRLNDRYGAAGRDLLRVTAALRELRSVPDYLRPTETPPVIAGLERRRSELEQSLRGAAIELTQLAFAAPGEATTPPPLPDLSDLPTPSGTVGPVPEVPGQAFAGVAQARDGGRSV